MKNLFKALANFQQEVPVIHKGTKGYGYTYADLPAIFAVINPLLRSNGLGFTQLMESKSIRTIVFHVESGERIESVTDIPQNVALAKMNEFQVLGSATSYIRRYSLSSLLCLVTDKDTDAGGEQKQVIVIPSEKLKRCKNLKELQVVYTGLTRTEQTQMEPLKNQLKTSLNGSQ